MFQGNLSKDAKKVINSICPGCNRKMVENMPHTKTERKVPICNYCNSYWTILGSGVCENKDVIEEKNRRWRLHQQNKG